MNKQILKLKLQKLGLEQEEADLYLFLLANGEKTPLEVSRETELNRSKVYRLTEVLSLKQLVEETETAWGRKLRAAPPENLELLIRQQEEELNTKRDGLEEVINDLKNLNLGSGSGFEVKHYRGIEGVRQMIWNELKSPEVLVFAYQKFSELLGAKFADTVREEIVLRKQKIFAIQNEDLPNSKVTNIEYLTKHYELREIPQSVVKIRHYIDIYRDVIAIYNMDGEIRSGIEIHNQALAEMFKQIFWGYWNQAKPIS